jgi:Flp pilus assembly protein TadG
MNRQSATLKNRQRGQAMVESALVLLVFLALLVGIADFGQVVFMHQGITERARNAARWGAIHFTDQTGARNMVLYNRPTVPDDDGDGNGNDGFMGLNSSMVTVSRQNQGTNEDRIVVRVSNYPFHFFSPWISNVYTGRPIIATAPVEAAN